MSKEIIIDGVNVAGCNFYQIEANELYPKAQYCGSMRNTFCENEPNCYYKQLKRLEQENAKLKQDIEAYKQSEQEATEIIAELKAENDRLKKDKIGLYSEIKQLEQENYGLNQELLGYKKGVQASEIIELKQTLQEIKAIVCGNYEIIDPQGRKDILKLITKAEEENGK